MMWGDFKFSRKYIKTIYYLCLEVFIKKYNFFPEVV